MRMAQLPTIVIVTYERLMTTRRCLEAVLEHTPHPLNLVLVDNGSREEVKSFLLCEPGIKLFLESNVGLYRALNLGIRLTDDELIAFLDCDVLVQPGWWGTLAEEVASDPTVGMAGSRYLNADGTLQEGYPALSADGWYGANYEDRSDAADCQYIAIGCSVFRRSAWACVNGFDEGYFISHGDIDFCYKLRYEAGLRIRYCPRSSVIHDRTFGREQEYELVRFDPDRCSADYERFRQKWEQKYLLEGREASERAVPPAIEAFPNRKRGGDA